VSVRLAVLVSGSGSNLQAIIDAKQRGELAADLTVVISNRPGVRAIERAKTAGVEALVIDHKHYTDRLAFDEALHEALTVRRVDLVALAGFMRLLTPTFVSRWRGRLVNLHPSLLPAFPGAHAIHDALTAKAARTGVTVHFVDEGTDTGPIIAQASVDIAQDDTEESLAARIRAEEHRLYPRALDALARGTIRLEGRTVVGGAALT
jgi:phosphoribosylglycinamide formyltransferase-1